MKPTILVLIPHNLCAVVFYIHIYFQLTEQYIVLMHPKYVLCASKLCTVQLGENNFVYIHNICVTNATGLTHRPVLNGIKATHKVANNFLGPCSTV